MALVASHLHGRKTRGFTIHCGVRDLVRSEGSTTPPVPRQSPSKSTNKDTVDVSVHREDKLVVGLSMAWYLSVSDECA